MPRSDLAKTKADTYKWYNICQNDCNIEGGTDGTLKINESFQINEIYDIGKVHGLIQFVWKAFITIKEKSMSLILPL